ncbi:MAG: bifunctional folylpolyglutamate synthase/dihydrofolate synthase [Clostridia bacterium]|nr:bifunctional folylpolyglutamate synthase/dihydrofolate synthase [Clostridia bacterium]
MTYEQTLDYIHSTLKFGSKPGLSRIRALMEALGNPQDTLRYVHITGTNGKGSTTTMVSNILRQAGLRVGTFISPYVDDFRERMQINGEMIPREALCRELEELLPAIEHIRELGHMHPTEFELVTALAFTWFAREKCDIVVLEVGMGGRLDCTNVIQPPLAAAIVSVSLDHTGVLGSTTAEIAKDKCGIIKPGSTAVCCFDQDEAALAVIREDAASKGVELRIPDKSALEITSSDIFGTNLTVDGLNLTISMPGAHQIQNAMTAYTIARVLQEKGVGITDENIVSGIAGTRFAGRLELIRKVPVCLLDGGHNPGGVDALCRALDTHLAGRKIIAVMGMMGDKATSYCIPEVAKRAGIFIGTQCDYGRAMPAQAVAQVASAYCDRVYYNENIATACRIAYSMASPDDVILVCGSLYILHDAREVLTYIE